ncbi:MAG: glycosyltransferase [Bacteroidota bacterium]
MVPSLHEGFGLVGLEAISAEIPLILSQNTGLYEAIRNSLGKKGLDCLWDHEILKPPQNHDYHEDNVKPISDSLINIFGNKKDSKESARSLRQFLLNESWTWESTARSVLEGLNLGESHSNEISIPNPSSTQSASEPLQKNVLDYPTSLQQFDEIQEQFPTSYKHNTPQFRVISNPLVGSRAEIPTFRKEILDLKRDIDRHLRFLENTEIKRILEENSPYPQYFESITECPIPIEVVLQTLNQLTRASENLEYVIQLNSSYQLVGQSKLAFNNCLRQISTLSQCCSRQSSRYVTALKQARDSFELAMQNLRDANLVLEQLAFLT